jgi:hypothetical protein
VRIAYAIPVRHVEPLKDGSFLALGIESSMFVIAVAPAVIRLAMLVCLAAPHVEATGDPAHTLRLRVLGPDLTEVQPPLVLPFGMAPGPNTPEGWEVKLLMPVGVTIPVAEAGTFSVEISADDDSLSVPIIIRLPDPPPV